MATAARLLTSLFQSSRMSFPVAAGRTNSRCALPAPAGAEEKSAREVSRPRFVSALLKALSALSV